MNKNLLDLFKQSGGYVEIDEQGNRFTYTYDFDPEKFVRLILEDSIARLQLHGYDDAANILIGAEIHSDKGYEVGTMEEYFEQTRRKLFGKKK